MKWISTKIRFPEAGKNVLTACKNKNMEDGIWLYDLCYYYSDTGWEGRDNWEDVLYWTYIDKPEENQAMAHYIDKDAVIAEIESYKNSFCDRNGYLENIEENDLAYNTLCDLEDSINTLEVKEVDLEKKNN